MLGVRFYNHRGGVNSRSTHMQVQVWLGFSGERVFLFPCFLQSQGWDQPVSLPSALWEQFFSSSFFQVSLSLIMGLWVWWEVTWPRIPLCIMPGPPASPLACHVCKSRFLAHGHLQVNPGSSFTYTVRFLLSYIFLSFALTETSLTFPQTMPYNKRSL